jgi:hypothetical protein
VKKTRRREPLEERPELLFGHPALADDGPHRAAGQVTMVHGYDGAEFALGVDEEEVACAVLAVINEASLLQLLASW